MLKLLLVYVPVLSVFKQKIVKGEVDMYPRFDTVYSFDACKYVLRSVVRILRPPQNFYPSIELMLF